MDSGQTVARHCRAAGVHELCRSIVGVGVEHELPEVGECVHVVPRGIEITVEVAGE